MNVTSEPSRPFRVHIPTELLSEIFLNCVDGAMDAANTIQIPLLVAQICTNWREAAIATPRLWSRLFLQLAPDNEAANAQSELVDTWLERSSAAHLSIYVFWEDPPFLGSHPVLDSLVLHSKRWENMFFYMPFGAFKSLARIRGRLDCLTELSLGSGDDPSIPINGTLDMFEYAPRLKSLECVNCSPFVFNFPWTQLKDVPVMAVSIEECLDILQRSSNLEQSGFIFLSGGISGPTGSIQHSHLRNFTIMTPPWNERVDLAQLFPRITLPSLENLTICNLKSSFGPGFVPFLSRLECIQSLQLRKTSISDADLVRGLVAIPSLKSLIVHCSADSETITDYLLTALTWTCRSTDGYLIPSLVPNLTKLELQIDESIAESFISMAQSRRTILGTEPDSPTIRLEHVKVRTAQEFEPTIVDQLDSLRLDGLSVDIEYIQSNGH
ncbi:hypothetical protein BDQ12DRAFT_683467 [Crucibulum laeve]|uniref:Uncharacterized protein n=1 Tax=Crucibulum laeve TaxID=68775 RepID=A0A5C3M029_9AGAR|nr:hypothetical protein BDQ12DRAFT_683467 [Crucibulum laeve]